jgi:CheY-like chemotaxis protein
MPEMDGYSFIRKIRTMSPEQGGNIPAIALTAYAGETDKQQVLAAGFTKHVAKPVVADELIALIAELVKICL